MSLVWRDRLSPNSDARGVPVDMLILHHTGMRDAAEALDRLVDPAAQVSCHWLVEEDGTIWRLVPEEHRAWHAGVSFWAGARNINARSIGIELVNPGHQWGYRAFPEAQMQAVEALAHDILTRHAIPDRRVLGHSDVAPDRKTDPGELFDWARLAAAGIGLWPSVTSDPALSAGRPEPSATAALAAIGYDVESGLRPAVIAAFQRHFLQAQVTGVLDAATLHRMVQVAAAFA